MMRVRSFLTARIDAGALMLNLGGRFAEAAVLLHWIRRDAARPVIGNHDRFTGLVHDDVTRSGAVRGLIVELRKLPGFGIDRKRADAAVVLFVHGVEVFVVGMDRQETGAWRF